MTLTLTKMGQRTVRQACDWHGTDSHYWVRDALNRWAWCDANVSTRRIAAGGPVPAFFLSECQPSPKAGRVYIPAAECIASRKGVGEAAPIVAEPEPVNIIGDPEPEAQLEAARHDVPEAAPVAAASELDVLRKLLGVGSVDPEQIRAMVKAEFANVVFPTETVVIRDGIERKVEGHSHCKLPEIILTLSSGDHVAMVGPAGTGKSHLAEQAAEALGLPFYAMSVGPQTSEAKILGYSDAGGTYHRTLFREAFEHGGVFLFDEIDAGHPGVLTIINAALANGRMAFPDTMVKRHPDFRCVAAANTYGRGPDRQYVGRQALDAATLDRFSVEEIDYDEALERQLCLATGLDSGKVADVLACVRKLRSNAQEHKMPVVVSQRGAMFACRQLAAGRTWRNVVASRFRKGLSDADWAKLSANAPAVTF